MGAAESTQLSVHNGGAYKDPRGLLAAQPHRDGLEVVHPCMRIQLCRLPAHHINALGTVTAGASGLQLEGKEAIESVWREVSCPRLAHTHYKFLSGNVDAPEQAVV